MSTSRSTQFKGFLMQALDHNENPIGYFAVPKESGSKIIDCPNNQTMVNRKLLAFISSVL